MDGVRCEGDSGYEADYCSRGRRGTRSVGVVGVQTCALPKFVVVMGVVVLVWWG